ncbi:hypothetical protein TNCV_503551 [Trichonephila clavipes]|nr:hypothetical protein TNCV_503551 [Trichonephila clavipes]
MGCWLSIAKLVCCTIHSNGKPRNFRKLKISSRGYLQWRYQSDSRHIHILLRQINKPSILQWIPAYVGIGGNEYGAVCVCDILAKKVRDLDLSLPL